MIKCIIFDKDGTLINHDKLFIPWLLSLIDALKIEFKINENIFKVLGFDKNNNSFKYNSVIPCGTNDDIKNTLLQYLKPLNKISDKEILDKLQKIFNNIHFDYENLETHGNLVEIFTLLKKKNYKIAICTSDDREPTEKMIEITGIKHLIHSVACGDDPNKSKPSSDPIIKICNELNIKPYETIMVGDTITDIQTARNAKCHKSISVLSGGFTKEELKDTDIIMKDISEIFTVIE